MVVDESGHPLCGVDVSYRINSDGWKPCGSSQGKAMELDSGYIKKGKEVNFVQYQPCFPQGGNKVSWRCRKSGYKEAVTYETMPAYPKGTGQDMEVFRKIKMTKLKGGSDHSRSSSSSKNSKSRSGFYCLDCDSKLVDLGEWEYYCPSCRLGKCDRCGGTYRPSYMVANKSRLIKEDNTVYCKGCAR